AFAPQDRKIETDGMADQDRTADKAGKFGPGRLERWSVRDRGGVDAMNARSLRRNRYARPHQPPQRSLRIDPPSADAHGSNLHDARLGGIEPRRLGVERHGLER